MTEYEKHAIPAAGRNGFLDALDGRAPAKRCWPADIMPHYHEGYKRGRIAAAAPAMVEALEGVRGWYACASPGDDMPQALFDKIHGLLAVFDPTPTAQPAAPTGEGDGLPPAEAFNLFPLTDWQFEVANGDTKRGYADWARANLEQQQETTASAAELTAICCTCCGSTSVCSDATARWNGHDWELSSTYDDSTCDACGYEGSGFEEVPLSELRAWREDQGFDADALEKDDAE